MEVWNFEVIITNNAWENTNNELRNHNYGLKEPDHENPKNYSLRWYFKVIIDLTRPQCCPGTRDIDQQIKFYVEKNQVSLSLFV